MKRQTKSTRVVLRTLSLFLTAAIVFQVAGCSKQFNAIEDNQLEMQQLMIHNNRQMADGMATMGQKQLDLQKIVQQGNRQIADNTTAVEKSRLAITSGMEASATKLARNMTAIEQRQFELAKAMGQNDKQIAIRIAAINKNQQNLKTSIANNARNNIRMIAAMDKSSQAMGSRISSNLNQVITSITAIEKNQTQLNSGIAVNARQIADNAAKVNAIADNLGQVHQMLSSVMDNTRQVTAKAAGIENGQAKLQEILLADIMKLNKKVVALEGGIARLEHMMAGMQISSDQVTAKVGRIEKNQQQFATEIDKSITRMVKNLDTIDQMSDSIVAKSSTTPKSKEVPVSPADSSQ